MNKLLIGALMISLGLSGCMAASPSSTGKNPAPDRLTYLQARDSLVSRDRSLWFDKDLVLDSAELLLNGKLVSMRQSMIESYKHGHFFPPASYFYKSKAHIESTRLFSILRKMPKGGILHLHGAASGDAQWVTRQVLSLPNAYVFWSAPQEGHTKGQIRFFKEGNQPQGFFAARELAAQYPGFADSLKSMLTFNGTMDRDSVDIWGEFEGIFNRLYGFISYQPVFKDYFRHAFQILVADGIQHVEIRGIFNQLYDLENGSGYYNPDSTVKYFQEVIANFRQTEPAFTLKLIYTDLRFRDREVIRQKLIQAFQLRQRYPDLVTGFDLVAEEDAGHSTLYFLDNWLLLDSLEQAYGVDMPLYLHDGESDWVSVDNLYDAVLLNSRRIGHGFNLFRFPHLIEEVKARDICLEINPISNQVLGFIGDLRLHPASTYLRRGVACTISSDDPLIFDYHGLSYDFWEVFMAWELDLRALKKLALNSLEYSGLTEKELKVSLMHFEKKWQNFINETLNELSD